MAKAPDDIAGAEQSATTDTVQSRKASASENTVEVRAKGTFHGDGNFQGNLVTPGDTFVVERGRAAELRANGLVEYTNQDDEKKAAESDAPAVEDTTNPGAITSRSFGRNTRAGR